MCFALLGLGRTLVHQTRKRLRTYLIAGLGFVLPVAAAQAQTSAAGKKPNILVLFGDDIGYWNVSAYNRGMMGYRTPNIDRIGKEGAIFTDVYAQQSCTAGRAAFITGQSPIRTGLLKVGLPGAPEGLHAEDPTIANLLKGHGYATTPRRALDGRASTRLRRPAPGGRSRAPRANGFLSLLAPRSRRRARRSRGLASRGPGSRPAEPVLPLGGVRKKVRAAEICALIGA